MPPNHFEVGKEGKGKEGKGRKKTPLRNKFKILATALAAG